MVTTIGEPEVGVATTLYAVIDAPPLLVGGVHESATDCEDGEALFNTGAVGGPAGVAVRIRYAEDPAAEVVAIRKLYC